MEFDIWYLVFFGMRIWCLVFGIWHSHWTWHLVFGFGFGIWHLQFRIGIWYLELALDIWDSDFGIFAIWIRIWNLAFAFGIWKLAFAFSVWIRIWTWHLVFGFGFGIWHLQFGLAFRKKTQIRVVQLQFPFAMRCDAMAVQYAPIPSNANGATTGSIPKWVHTHTRHQSRVGVKRTFIVAFHVACSKQTNKPNQKQKQELDHTVV